MSRRGLPHHYEHRTWTELFDFTDPLLNFSASSGVLEKTVDPVTGKPTLKWSGMTAGASISETSFTPTVPFILDDIIDEPIKFDIRINKAAMGLQVAFGMGSFALADIRRYFFSAGSFGEGLNGLLTHQGLPADPIIPLQTWSGTGDTSATITHFSLVLSGQDVDGLEIYLSPVEYGGRNRAKVMFGMDNHSNSFGSVQSHILPDMQALGWGGYMAWSSNENPWVGETDLADTLSMVNDDGWTVCNHTIDHVTADVMELEDDPIAVAKQQYLDNAIHQVLEGFPESHCYRYSAQPGNDMTINLKTALEEMGFVYSRSAAPTFISSTTTQYNNNWTGTYSINSISGSGAAIDVEAIVDYALSSAVLMGCSINFFIHGLHDTQIGYMTFADWDYFIAEITKYRNAGLIDLVSVDEWYKGLTSPRVPAGARVAT